MSGDSTAYVDYAEYYDYEAHVVDDVPFYLEYAAASGSPILELACGTGRVLVPLAEAGFEMSGVDLSANMLARCQDKVAARGLSDRVQLFQADMASFELPRRDFSLIYIPVRSFMHLFSQEAEMSCLARAYAHLRPGGTFIVDVYAPDFALLAREPGGDFERPMWFNLPNGRPVLKEQRFLHNDRARQINHYELRFQEHDPGGGIVRERRVPMDTRYTFRYELQLLFERAGFEVADVFGDYARGPYDGTREIIMVGRR
jgi:SAM-dependent methyltransferase